MRKIIVWANTHLVGSSTQTTFEVDDTWSEEDICSEAMDAVLSDLIEWGWYEENDDEN